MYVAGTRWTTPDTHEITVRDAIDDTLIPFNMVDHTERYKQAVTRWTPGITTIVGHSLGASVAARMTEYNVGINARVYAWPTMRVSTDPRVQSFRHFADPISLFDRSASTSLPDSLNPHAFTGY